MRAKHKKLGIVLPQGLDAGLWETEFEANLVPDRLPYGLHRLSEVAGESVVLEAKSLGIRDKATLVAKLVRPQSAPSGDGGLGVNISWDEYTAAKMFTQYPAEAMFSGVIWATDEWLSGKHGVRGKLTKRLIERLSGAWCLSRPQVDELQRQTRSRVPVDYLRFGIDHNFFKYSPQPSGLRILSLGVDRDRDPGTLFAALEIVREKIPAAEIFVQTNSTLPMPDGVVKLNRVSHAVLRDLYRTANVVLVPTKHNLHVSGMTVALETGATGRPVVVCNTPGMEDYVIHGHTGLLVPPGNAAAMANATIDVLHDREMAASLGAEARRHVEENHTSQRMVEDLGEIIAKAL